jgi:hypothetical protein
MPSENNKPREYFENLDVIDKKSAILTTTEFSIRRLA